jgi:dihydrofolate reductase
MKTTRKVIYGGACSLDGFFADRNGGVDWLTMSKDVQAIMTRMWATVDTVLTGRKTYEFAAKMGGGPEMPGVKGYVFSRTLTSIADKNSELVNSDAGEFVRALKAKPGKDMIVMSGGNLAASLLRAGVVDEIGMNIHPVLLGAGVPAFMDPGDRVKLELTETRQLEGGCVLVMYRVKH